MTKPKSPPSRAAAVATFWCVHLRTAQKWLAEPGRAASPPTPPASAIDDPAAMIAWVRSLPTASQAKLTRPFRARVDHFRLALERGDPLRPDLRPSANHPEQAQRAEGPAPPPPGGNPRAGPAGAHYPQSPFPDALEDPDYTAFLQARESTPTTTQTAAATHIAALKLQRDFAVYKLQRARQRRDAPAAREAIEDIRYLSSVIYDEETLAQKLHRDLGESLPRPEAARLLRALAYWLLRGTDDLLATLAPLLARASAHPLFPEEVRRLLEPHLLADRVLAPFTRAARLNAGTTLPAWALDEMRAALAATLEDGAALFDTLYQAPITRETTGPSPDPVAASEPPSVSAIPDTPTASAISSVTPDLGSGANQTA